MLVLQGGYYVKVFLSIQNNQGSYIRKRRGALTTVSSDTPFLNTRINISGYSITQVNRYFNEIALMDEALLYKDVVRKWTTHIFFYAEGDVDALTEEVLNNLFEELNSIEGFPGISRTFNQDEASLLATFTTTMISLHLQANTAVIMTLMACQK